VVSTGLSRCIGLEGKAYLSVESSGNRARGGDVRVEVGLIGRARQGRSTKICNLAGHLSPPSPFSINAAKPSSSFTHPRPPTPTLPTHLACRYRDGPEPQLSSHSVTRKPTAGDVEALHRDAEATWTPSFVELIKVHPPPSPDLPKP